MQGLGVKQPRGFAKGAQRRRPNPQSSLNGLQGRSLLQSAQAGNRGTKEVEQQEADVLVVEQLAVAGPITLGTDVFESRQQGHQRVEILQAFNVTRLQSSSTWSGHRCLHAIPEILRVRMKASRKYHANPLAQNSCRTVLPHGGLGGLSRHPANSRPDFRSSSSSFLPEKMTDIAPRSSGEEDSRSLKPFRWNPAGNQSRPVEPDQQPEASLAWRVGDHPCEA